MFEMWSADLPVGVAHGTQCLTFVLLLTQGLPLVEFLLASGERDFRLDPSVFEVQAQRHDGVPLGFRLPCELGDLFGMQQKLPLALGRMVVPRTVQIFGNIRSFKPYLARDRW